MAGTSDQTRRVRYVNANYQAADIPGAAGTFALLVVTEDDERHVLEPDAGDMTALVALINAGSVLLWDPVARTLVVANLVGDWLPEDWSAPT